jgi:hypothetical protein
MRCSGDEPLRGIATVAYSTGTATGDLFAGTYFGCGAFRSTDNSDTWSEKNTGLIATRSEP